MSIDLLTRQIILQSEIPFPFIGIIKGIYTLPNLAAGGSGIIDNIGLFLTRILLI